eukprot:10674926-Alexandrium_andersonii.AAC.1
MQREARPLSQPFALMSRACCGRRFGNRGRPGANARGRYGGRGRTCASVEALSAPRVPRRREGGRFQPGR